MAVALLVAPSPAAAQRSGIELRGSIGGEVAAPEAPSPPPSGTPPAPSVPSLTAPSAPPKDGAAGGLGEGEATLRLVALLSDDGQPIERGLVWRVFSSDQQRSGRAKLVATHRQPAPTLRLRAGTYTISAAFGKAHVVRRVTLAGGGQSSETLVLNAGGLRLTATLASGQPAATGTVSFDVLSDERDQAGNRTPVLTGAKPGVVVRLNSGIYHVVSTYGDANAKVRTDVTVEAGKLTEVAARHAAARVTFRLVAKPGGEATPDTLWTIAPADGPVLRETVGALPTHVLAPGTYVAIARSSGRTFRRSFAVRDGDRVQVEVLMQ